jgi:cysteine synthase
MPVDTTRKADEALVVAASMGDNALGASAMDRVVDKAGRLVKVFCDGGFKNASASTARSLAPPRRW